ncbi:MAG: hypothetical protein CMJ31_11430 [Phycisphaerae bacterium]|nr:hypothetical protein [Phycisphaerae bacterium]
MYVQRFARDERAPESGGTDSGEDCASLVWSRVVANAWFATTLAKVSGEARTARCSHGVRGCFVGTVGPR